MAEVAAEARRKHRRSSRFCAATEASLYLPQKSHPRTSQKIKRGLIVRPTQEHSVQFNINLFGPFITTNVIL